MSAWSLRLLVLSALLGAACAPQLNLPPGVTCASTSSGGTDATSLTAALQRAHSGDCVSVSTATYAGALTVPPGVTLAAELGAEPKLSNASAASAALTLSAGANAAGLKVVSPAGIGVLVQGHSSLKDITVSGAGSAAMLAWCEEDCLTEPPTSLSNVTLTDSAVGLWVRGAAVSASGGRVANNQSQSLASGYGVVVSHGGALTLSGTTVEANQELGVLVDGALGTSATLEDVAVKDNLGRGVWAQGLLGTMAAPKLSLKRCAIEGNALAGVGARSSKGITIEDGRIAGTVLAPAPTTMPGITAQVGDGVGLFEDTGDVRLDGVALEQNQRSQVLIDKGNSGLVVQGGSISPQAGQLAIVVQRTTAVVQAPSITTPMPGMELPVAAPQLSVPVR